MEKIGHSNLPNLTISESEVLLAKMICLPIISIRIDNDEKCDVIPPELFEKCIRKKNAAMGHL